jgi:hypothetical protein
LEPSTESTYTVLPVVGQAQPFFADAVQVRPDGQTASACQVAQPPEGEAVQRSGVLPVAAHCTSARCVQDAPACAGASVQTVPEDPLEPELPVELLELAELDVPELDVLELDEPALDEPDELAPDELALDEVALPELDALDDDDDVDDVVEAPVEPALELDAVVEPAELEDDDDESDEVLVDPAVEPAPASHLPAWQLWPSGQLASLWHEAPVVSTEQPQQKAVRTIHNHRWRLMFVPRRVVKGRLWTTGRRVRSRGSSRTRSRRAR